MASPTKRKTLSEEQSSTKNQIASLFARSKETAQGLKEVTETVNSMRSDLTAIKGAIVGDLALGNPGMVARLSSIEGEVKNLGTKISDQGNKHADTAEEVSQLQTKAEELKKELEVIKQFKADQALENQKNEDKHDRTRLIVYVLGVVLTLAAGAIQVWANVHSVVAK